MRQKRILLIDEDLKQLFLTKAQLQHTDAGVDVEIARSETEGLEKLRIKQFDCVVRALDDRQTVEGSRLVETLRSLNIAAPLVFLSQYEDELEDEPGTRCIHRDSRNQFTRRINEIIESVGVSGYSTPSAAGAQPADLEQLQAILAQYETAFEQTESMIMLMSPDGRTVERCTPKLERYFKPEGQETAFRKVPFVMLISPLDRPRMRTFIRDVLQHGEKEGEFTFLARGGREILFRVKGVSTLKKTDAVSLVLFVNEVQ